MPFGGTRSSRTVLPPKDSLRGNSTASGEVCSSGTDLTKGLSRGEATPLGGTSPTGLEPVEGSA